MSKSSCICRFVLIYISEHMFYYVSINLIGGKMKTTYKFIHSMRIKSVVLDNVRIVNLSYLIFSLPFRLILKCQKVQRVLVSGYRLLEQLVYILLLLLLALEFATFG